MYSIITYKLCTIHYDISTTLTHTQLHPFPLESPLLKYL